MNTESKRQFHREQAQLRIICAFPHCPRAAVHGTSMCDRHELVRVADNGSWDPDEGRA